MNLTEQELLIGAHVGAQRRIDSLDRPDRVPGIVDVRGGWNTDIEAALAEIAYARTTGTYWDFSVGTFDKPDVGTIQVKHTDGLEGRRCLILRPGHDDRQMYALVVGLEGRYEVYAPVSGGEVKRLGERRDPGDRGHPCWMLPKDAMRRLA